MVNGITLYRMAAAPLLLLLIINHQPGIFKWLLAVSFLTDAIDGQLARRYKVVSVLGAKLDSLADNLTIVVAITGIIVFKSAFLRQENRLIILLLTLYVLQTIFAVARYGKISSFHTYAAKTAAILQGIFLLLLFFIDEPVYLLFYITAAVTSIELLEEIILVGMLPQWKSDVKGLYWVLKRREGLNKTVH
jgi:CDP-diacylglycerol--glycerol-3-phosphate 3-phosphatidyltransferase